jgi:hypothetical protein
MNSRRQFLPAAGLSVADARHTRAVDAGKLQIVPAMRDVGSGEVTWLG